MIGEITALGAAICWAISAILYRKAMTQTNPMSANIIRCASAGAILAVCLAIIGKIGLLTNLPTYALILAATSGIIGLGFGDTLYLISLKYVGVGRAVPITCTYPLFSLLWTVFLQGQSVTLQVILGALVIVFGVWLLTRRGQGNADSVNRKMMTKGTIAALLTAIIWSVSITMIDVAVTLPETSTLEGAFTINTLRTSAVAVFLLAFSPLTDKKRGFLKVSKKTLATIVSAGVVALALGWFFLAYSFLCIPEARAVPISSTSPLFATVSAMFFLHERMTVKSAAGSAMVVVGIFLIFI